MALMSRAANRDEARRMACILILAVTCQWTGEEQDANHDLFPVSKHGCVFTFGGCCNGSGEVFKTRKWDEHREVVRPT
jgi:hypothetical protein